MIFGLSACEPIKPVTEEEAVTCTPYRRVNERVSGLGMDLCSDGTVVNWDGMERGVFETVEGNTVTIKWAGGPISDLETFEATALTCRMDGTLKDC